MLVTERHRQRAQKAEAELEQARAHHDEHHSKEQEWMRRHKDVFTQLRQAEAAAAEMRAALGRAGPEIRRMATEGSAGFDCAVIDAIDAALAIDVGRGWVSPEQAAAMVFPRETVRRFAVLMERTLRANDHKGGWSDCDLGWLRGRLADEVVELSDVTATGNGDIAREAADVANFAMMIADVAGALPDATDAGRALLERVERYERALLRIWQVRTLTREEMLKTAGTALGEDYLARVIGEARAALSEGEP